MPASENNDPISFALNNSFKSKVGTGGGNYVSQKMETSLRKSLLVNVEFDDPVVYTKSEIKSSYIVLASNTRPVNTTNTKEVTTNGHIQSNASSSSVKSNKPRTLDQVPAPKITLYRKEQIQVGYNRMTGPGAGMKNMGNTCYLNSTLQALFHIPALVNYLSSGGHDKECSISGFSSCTICVMNSTLRQSQQSSVIKPIRIYEKLKLICKHLVHGRQEDAHEFLRYLIESLQRCYLISRKVPKTLENYSKETTPFNQIFGGYLRQELHCLKCRHVSITFQHFMDLMLDIRNADNIESALTGYFKRETLSQEDMYKCEKCQQKVPAYKIYRIERPPLVLCIQLKRFHIMGGKNGRPVTLARNLDITRFIRWASGCDLTFSYTLTSLITHVGPSPNCGHYTAIGQAPNGTYYRFDDDSVNPTSVQNVLNTSAYVIFYEMTRASRDRYLSAMNNVNSATSGNGGKSESMIGPQLPTTSSSSPAATRVPSKPVPSTSSAGLVKPTASASSPGPVKLKPEDKSSNRPMASNNMPRLISSPAADKSLDKERAKFGVVVPNKPVGGAAGTSSGQLAARGLVPDYGDGSSSDDEEPSSKSKENNVPKSSNVENKDSNNHTSHESSSKKHQSDAFPLKKDGSSQPTSSKSLFPGIRTPFLPRAVAANLKKNHATEASKSKTDSSGSSSKHDSFNIYDEQDLVSSGEKSDAFASDSHAASTSSSGMHVNNASDGSVPSLADIHANGIDIGAKSSQERHGFTVSDKEAHNPSIHSDNSSGSTVSFTVSDLRPGSAGTSASSSSTAGSSSRQSWNVVSVKRDRSDEEGTAEPNDEACGSPIKKSKLKEEAKKSVLDDVKTKTTETLREFSRDFMSAGAKLKQQFEIKSSKVTDKLETISKNIEDIIPKFEEPSTSCEASTSQGSSKLRDADDESEMDSHRKKNKKKKKKKKKNNERSRSRSRSVEKQKEKSKGNRNRSRSNSNDRSPVRHNDKFKDEKSSSTNGDVRHSSWDRSAPVKRWDSGGKGDHRGKLDRSATWDGSKGSTSFLDEIKRSSTIRSWSGSNNRKEEDARERKRSVSPGSDDEEMDRGRVKKVKKKREDRKLPYNPFQVVQNIKDRGGPSYLVDKYKKRNHSYSGFRGEDGDGHRSKERYRERDHYREDYRGGNHGGRFNDHYRKDHRQGWDHNYHRN